MAVSRRDFVVQPHVGIGPIRLGMRSEELRQAVGKCKVTAGDDGESFIDAHGLKIDCVNGVVAFVEASAVARVRVRLFDRDIFDTPADEMVGVVVRHAKLPRADFPLGQVKYLFPTLRLALWRGIVPDGPGEPGWVFDTVSVHNPGYYDA